MNQEHTFIVSLQRSCSSPTPKENLTLSQKGVSFRNKQMLNTYWPHWTDEN